jgi:hypothetical protein
MLGRVAHPVRRRRRRAAAEKRAKSALRGVMSLLSAE